jgi:ATP-binding cassette subfamily B protein
VPLPLVTVVVKYFGHAIHTRFEKIQEQLSDISAIAQESLAGVRVVRAYGQESFEVAKFRRANEEYVHRNRALIRLQGFYFPSMGLLMGIGALLVLWLGSRRVVAGEMTLGELVAFNAYLTMLGWPMIAFGWVSNLLQRGMASWKRLLEILDAEPLVSDAEAIETIQSIEGEIEFRNLTFSFGKAVVLHGISFKVPRGTTTAIVGGTGSGKSTLLNLLPRLHEPPAGTVFIDGVDVRHIPLRVLRGAIGFVNRSRSSSARRWRRTSLLAHMVNRVSATGLPRPQPSRGSIRTWRSSPKGTRPRWESAASRCQAGRSNVSRSRGRW